MDKKKLYHRRRRLEQRAVDRVLNGGLKAVVVRHRLRAHPIRINLKPTIIPCAKSAWQGLSQAAGVEEFDAAELLRRGFTEIKWDGL